MRKVKKSAVNNSRTRVENAHAQEEYTATDGEVKKSAKTDKRYYVDSLTEDAKQAADSGNMRQLCLYHAPQEISRQIPELPVKDKEGNIIIEL